MIEKNILTITKDEIKIVDDIFLMDDNLPYRTIGYAYENTDGNQYWYLDGKLHREEGPAVITKDKSIIWFTNGKETVKTDEEIKEELIKINDKLVEPTENIGKIEK